MTLQQARLRQISLFGRCNDGGRQLAIKRARSLSAGRIERGS